MESLRKPWVKKLIMGIVIVSFIVPMAAIANTERNTGPLIFSPERLKELNKEQNPDPTSTTEDSLNPQEPKVYRTLGQAAEDGVALSKSIDPPPVEKIIPKEVSPYKDIVKTAGLGFLAFVLFGWILSKIIVRKYGHLVDQEES